MHRCILHLDIDAFLASIEQILEPSLAGRPVAVGSGVVASRSYEAKARGVHTAMAMAEARRRCPDLVVRDGDARVAELFRQKVAGVLREFAPVVQVCSLDDMYADLTGVPLPAANGSGDAGADGHAGAIALAAQIRARVAAATGLSVSQGIATTKSVARMATMHAKPGGIRAVAAGTERAFLAPHPLRDLPGIGAATARALEDWNLTTIGELMALEPELLRRTFGARGVDLWRRVHGIDEAPVVDSPPVLSISRETSFDDGAVAAARRKHGGEADVVRAMLAYLLDRAAAELRGLCLCARTVQVRLRHVDHVTQAVSRTLPRAADDTVALGEVARALLQRLLQRRVQVRLVGVTLSSLQRAPRQGELFATPARQHRQLLRAVDAVRARHGFGKLVLGGATGLLGQVPNTAHGFRLRTPSLTK